MRLKIAVLLLLTSLLGMAQAGMNEQLHELQRAWAIAKYQTPEDQAEKAFADLTRQAQALEQQYPNRAEPKIWLAIVLASDAGVNGGFSALSKVKQARALLEQSLQIDPTALEGSAYTSLGSLYYQVPGWPIAFGNDDKAADYLQKALELNPQGIDANYFYGDFLLNQDQPAEALKYLQKALQAPARPGRELADQGRRGEIEQAIAKARKQL